MIPKAFPKTLFQKTKISECPAAKEKKGTIKLKEVSLCVVSLLNPHFAFCAGPALSVLTATVFFSKISRREALLISFKKILATEESTHTLAQ